MKKVYNKNSKKIILATLILTLALALTSCGWLNAVIGELKGELIGNDYVITQYDNFGNPVLQVEGDKIQLEGTSDTSGELSSYITVTIDGYEWDHVGSTSTGLIPVDRVVNHYKNLFGKKSVVIVSSQNGTPIGLFQGDNCYKDIPSDLPKTTRINIDGKMVYVHRADVDIMPADMFISR